jgi:prefoldin subunit 5
VGAAAGRASAALGAEAYTTGHRVAFASVPSLHTAAHEFAHVVQQRAGVALKGGMGEKGDVYERHADEVAKAVVGGRSAEPLLDRCPPAGGPPAEGVLQRQTPGEAAQHSASEPAVEPALTPGDRARKAILEAAERRLAEKTTIVSEAKIQDIREGMVRFKLGVTPEGEAIELRLPLNTPVKNFTTCIEFAGQSFGDAAKVMGKGPGDAARIARLLPNLLKIFNEETQLNAQIEAFQKAVRNFDAPIAKVEARRTTFEDKAKELEESKTGDKARDKAIDLQIRGQSQAIRQLDAAIAKMEREQQKFRAKVGRLESDRAVLDAQDDALVRAEPGLPNGRPKPGELILLGAGAAQAYGVSTATRVSLAKGSFKHIAVFRSLEDAPSPKDKPNEKWEKWSTIDGGGTAARATQFYLRLSDLRVQFAEPDKPWASSTTALIGWIDMDTLMAEQTPAGRAASTPG